MLHASKDLTSIDKTRKEYIISYWNERAEGFTTLRSHELHSEKYHLWKDEIIRHIPDHSLRILDVGCGAGFFSMLLASMGHTVVGIDMSSNMIAASYRLANSEGYQIDFQLMDAERLLFENNFFDVVIARNVTWNLPNPCHAYQEWLRVLKRNGILLNYDADYAKNHATQLSVKSHAHKDISPTLLAKCQSIYEILPMSHYTRPDWDKEILEQYHPQQCIVDTTVGSRIYELEDEFYITAPMFCIKAIK